ncbi:MAG: hypothetical protein ACKVOT_13830 [Polaromonas sp.]
MVDLLFRAAPGTTDLVFGGEDYVAPIQKLYVSHELLLPPPLFAASVQVATAPIFITVGITLVPPTFSAAVRYDNRVTRYRGEGVAAAHQVANVRRKVISSEFGPSKRELGGTVLRYGLAKQLLVDVASVAGVSAGLAQNASLPWGLGQQLGAQTTSVMEAAAGRRAHATAAWQLAVGRQTIAAVVMETGARRRARITASWSSAQTQHRDLDSRFGASTRHQVRSALVVWQQARHPAQGREAWPPVIVQPPIGYTPSTALLFQCPPLSAPYVLFFGSHPCAFINRPSILPAKVYMTTHNLIAHRLPDLVEVPLYNATLSADVGSFAWQFSATGPDSLFNQLAPDTGLPQQLQIVLDGMVWVFLVESIKRDHAFGKRTVSISGRSVTALLGAPWARAEAFNNPLSANAQQLAAQALDLSGVALDWGITDWLVDANAWSYSGTRLAAVQAIAEAAGGYIQSHRSLAELQVRHPYPMRPDGSSGGPWNWATGAADIELAPDAIITSAIERRDGPDVNAVYVSGTTQGVLARILRAGSAGDKLADLQTDALITQGEAAGQRGLSVLGKAGPKYAISLELPVLTGFGQPGVIDVGQLIQINDSTPWRGRVSSVSVNAAMPKARQTITLERHLADALTEGNP